MQIIRHSMRNIQLHMKCRDIPYIRMWWEYFEQTLREV